MIHRPFQHVARQGAAEQPAGRASAAQHDLADIVGTRPAQQFTRDVITGDQCQWFDPG